MQLGWWGGGAARLRAPRDPHPTPGGGGTPCFFWNHSFVLGAAGAGHCLPTDSRGGGGEGGSCTPVLGGQGGAQPMGGRYQSTALSRWAKPGSRRSFQ